MFAGSCLRPFYVGRAGATPRLSVRVAMAVAVLDASKRPWGTVRGPFMATILTFRRIGWNTEGLLRSARTMASLSCSPKWRPMIFRRTCLRASRTGSGSGRPIRSWAGRSGTAMSARGLHQSACCSALDGGPHGIGARLGLSRAQLGGRRPVYVYSGTIPLVLAKCADMPPDGARIGGGNAPAPCAGPREGPRHP